MRVRQGKIEDLFELQKLFVDTIKKVCSKDYNPEQIDAWVSGIQNTHRWEHVLRSHYVFIAEEKEEIIGFGTLDSTGYIDFLFVHHNFQNQGVARCLYHEIEKRAILLNLTELTSNVSITAKSFFLKMGFTVVKAQIIDLKEVFLQNYRMKKPLI